MAGRPKFSKSARPSKSASARNNPRDRKRNSSRFPDRIRQTAIESFVDYKEVELLRKLMSGSGKIMSRKRAGTTHMEQRDVRNAIKRARFLALLPFVGS